MRKLLDLPKVIMVDLDVLEMKTKNYIESNKQTRRSLWRVYPPNFMVG